MNAHHSSRIDRLPASSFVVAPIWSAPIFSTALSARASPPFVANPNPSGHAGATCRRRYVRASLIANAAGVGTRSTPLMSPPVSSARETSQLRSSSRLELELELSRTALRLGLPAGSDEAPAPGQPVGHVLRRGQRAKRLRLLRVVHDYLAFLLLPRQMTGGPPTWILRPAVNTRRVSSRRVATPTPRSSPAHGPAARSARSRERVTPPTRRHACAHCVCSRPPGLAPCAPRSISPARGGASDSRRR